MADFTWSYSSLKDYIGCAKRYQETKVLKNYVFQDTAQTIYGKEVHKALEDYVKSNTTLAKNYERYKKLVDDLIAIPGDKYCEYEMALTKEKRLANLKILTVGFVVLLTWLLLTATLHLLWTTKQEAISTQTQNN